MSENPEHSLDRAPRRRRGDAERVRAIVARDLRAGRWREGDKLPTERELGAQYGVARNTVRRALQSLEAEALIVRHVGRGTFRAIGTTAPDPFAVDPESLSPADVVECRLIFEPELATLAVARATAADFEQMEVCLRGADAAPDAAGFEHWDARLHDAIATATRNHTVVAMARALAQVRLNAEWGKLKARGMTAERKSALQEQHRAIVAALRQRDREEARALLRTHILYVRAYMFGE
jgi:DNA-binding FadR family transcriptional regulator